MSLPFDRLRAAQEASAEPAYATPAKIRLTALSRIIMNWLEQGGATASQQQEMWRALQAERNRLVEFLAASRPEAAKMDQSRLVADRFQAGLECHARACDYLALALAEARADACEEAARLVDEGDRLMGEAEGHIQRLRAMYPLD